MFIVHVFVHVKPDRIEDFKQATLENAREFLVKGPKVFDQSFLSAFGWLAGWRGEVFACLAFLIGAADGRSGANDAMANS